MRAAGKASLATIGAGGAPFASLVTVATDQTGAPLLLLSRLAEHRRNLLADDRVAVLIDGTAGFANPQAGPRATFTGRVEASADPAHRARFLARHPAAKGYAGFADFEILRVAVERIHWVGGFARAAWLDFLPVGSAAAAAIGAAEADILAHMNADHAETVHAETVQRYAVDLLKRRGKSWRMVACDADGCDLAQVGRVARLAFDVPAGSVDDVRARLVGLSRLARGPSA